MPLSGTALDEYSRRIGVATPCRVDLATLESLHLAHAAAIPFENLSPFCGEPVRLDPESLVDKLVRRARGGYCFEQNLLFWHVLEAIGFEVGGLSARVCYTVQAGAVMPRTHMLLRVELPEGSFIADVGFGLLTLTGALRLAPGIEQSTPHETCRLMQAAPGFTLEARIGAAWKPLYLFDLQPQLQTDYEVTNWYTSTHPASRFVTGLMMARPEADKRHALLNATYSIHLPDGSVERRALRSVAEMRETMRDAFGLEVPDLPGLDGKLRRLLASS